MNLSIAVQTLPPTDEQAPLNSLCLASTGAKLMTKHFLQTMMEHCILTRRMLLAIFSELKQMLLQLVRFKDILANFQPECATLTRGAGDTEMAKSGEGQLDENVR